MACCRCQDEDAFCNNNMGQPAILPIEDFPVRRQMPGPGLTCQNNLDCTLFDDCVEDDGACRIGDNLVEDDISLRQAGQDQGCPRGQALCCNPVPGDLLSVRAGLITSGDPLGDGGSVEPEGRNEPICERQELAAVVNFNFGVSCGKRDSRVYHQVRLSKEEGGEGEVTNPGEWPWAALIFNGNDYVGSGVLLDNDVVVTTATKVQKFLRSPSDLTIRIGDFDPTSDYPNPLEDFPHVEMEVVCIKLHPRANYPTTLEYNVAVLKMRVRVRREPGNRNQEPDTKAVVSAVSVVDLRSAPRRPANQPEGVDGFRRNEAKDEEYGDELSLRQGLLSDLNNEVDPLGEPISGDPVDSFVARSYINTACLPRSTRQFPAGTRCWVAAWGRGLREQREISLPLVSKSECEAKLRPEFRKRGVNSWDLHSSELCAGGEVGVDTCDGEGGAPLVCLDEDTDQFYAVGLVGYGFGCEDPIPAVYTNLANSEVKSFIETAFSQNFC